jgi:hypothetical protein
VPREELERREEEATPPSLPEVGAAKRTRTPPTKETLHATPNVLAADAEPDPSEDPPPTTATIHDPPAPDAKKPRTPGRGNDPHKRLQELIKRHANGLGLRAAMEAPLPDGCAVDVLLEGQSVSIAVEVADGSSLGQEMKNIAKAFAAGIPEVVVVSDDPRHLERIKAEAQAIGIDADGTITFVESKDIGDYFVQFGASLAGYETTSRGYNVKVRLVGISDEEREQRLAAIHRAIARHQAEKSDDGLTQQIRVDVRLGGIEALRVREEVFVPVLGEPFLLRRLKPVPDRDVEAPRHLHHHLQRELPSALGPLDLLVRELLGRRLDEVVVLKLPALHHRRQRLRPKLPVVVFGHQRFSSC